MAGHKLRFCSTVAGLPDRSSNRRNSTFPKDVGREPETDRPSSCMQCNPIHPPSRGKKAGREWPPLQTMDRGPEPVSLTRRTAAGGAPCLARRLTVLDCWTCRIPLLSMHCFTLLPRPWGSTYVRTYMFGSGVVLRRRRGIRLYEADLLRVQGAGHTVGQSGRFMCRSTNTNRTHIDRSRYRIGAAACVMCVRSRSCRHAFSAAACLLYYHSCSTRKHYRYASASVAVR